VVVIAAYHQIHVMLPAKILDVVAKFAAGDRHVVDRVIGFFRQSGEKISRFFMHQVPQVFQHRRSKLVI
jgi:hypothetical protein